MQARPSCLRLLTHCERRAASRGLDGRQQQRDEHGDDGDDDEQLDQREAEAGPAGRTRGMGVFLMGGMMGRSAADEAKAGARGSAGRRPINVAGERIWTWP